MDDIQSNTLELEKMKTAIGIYSKIFGSLSVMAFSFSLFVLGSTITNADKDGKVSEKIEYHSMRINKQSDQIDELKNDVGGIKGDIKVLTVNSSNMAKTVDHIHELVKQIALRGRR